jgi:CheY-like chemotaxis protein
VDESRICAKTLANISVDLGHTVAVAHSGAQCLALAATQRFDRILLDISLPDASEQDLCDCIYREGRSRGASIAASPVFVQREGGRTR